MVPHHAISHIQSLDLRDTAPRQGHEGPRSRVPIRFEKGCAGRFVSNTGRTDRGYKYYVSNHIEDPSIYSNHISNTHSSRRPSLQQDTCTLPSLAAGNGSASEESTIDAELCGHQRTCT